MGDTRRLALRDKTWGNLIEGVARWHNGSLMVLGWDKVKAVHPVFAGDILYAESTVKPESKSRPTQAIATVSTRGVNQDGEEVMRFERTMLIYKRDHSPEEAANY